MRWLLSALAGIAALSPAGARAGCYSLGNVGEQVCFTGVFPNDPILVEYGQPVLLPDSVYTNDTDREITFTIEWAGVDMAGSGGIPGVTLAPRSEQGVTGLSLPLEAPVGTPIPVGTHQIVIGWTAQGGDYVVTVQRPFELVVLEPAQLREIIQVPTRWCVVEGSPQAGAAKPGETVDGTMLLSLLRQMNNEIWLPQASILFRHASAPQGIPVVKDPYPGENLGDLAMSNNDEWHTAGALCEQEWARRYPEQRGTVMVNGRVMIAETLQVIGGISMAVPLALRVGGQRGDDLCGHPRHLRVDDLTWLSITTVYDQMLFGQARFNYIGEGFKPTRVLAHELGHTLTLAHGNGLDDNHDGLAPPTPGTRRYDEYCDLLGLTPSGSVAEDIQTPFSTCEASSSLMLGSTKCTNLQPHQREMAREAAKLVPGAVVADPALDPAGQLVAPTGGCPPDCAIPRSLVLRKVEMAVTPGSGVTSFSHGVLKLLPLPAPSRYLVFADLDHSAQTGCSASVPGLPVFAGAELKTEVAVSVTGGIVTATPRIWRCEGGGWVEKSELGIRATAYAQPVSSHEAGGVSAGGVITVEMPDAVRGPAGTEVRLQAVSAGGGFNDLLPADGQGGLVSLTTPALPSCSVSPPIARPGQQLNLAVTGLPVNQAADIFVGDEAVGAAVADPDGRVATAMVVPATFAPGVRSIEARSRGGAVSAVCAVLVQGDALTPATTATLTPEPNWNDWNDTVVTVSLAAVDAPGGPGIRDVSYSATGAQPITATTVFGAHAEFGIAQEGHTVVTYFATNKNGVSEAPHALTVSIDLAAPAIAFTGNQGVYGVLDDVAITCTASDSLSGVIWSTCHDVTGPAYQFEPGVNTYVATAGDAAGNVGSGSTSFELRVTYGDLCTLTRLVIESSSLTPSQAKLLGSSLCAQLGAAEAAQSRGALQAKQQALDAYVKQVIASSRVAFTPAEVEILIKLARAL